MFYLSPLTHTPPNHFLPLLGKLDPGTGESRCRLAILKACFVLINWLIREALLHSPSWLLILLSHPLQC